ncbi:MAG: phosphoribosyltransferase family protein [Chloroflexota bacterium]
MSNLSHPDTYTVDIAGVKRHLRLFEVAPGLQIAVLNILGDTEFVRVSARELAKKLSTLDYDVLVTAEAKSIPLVHVLAEEAQKPYVVLRKSYKPYMGNCISAETLSITTGKPQTLFLDEKDYPLIHNMRVILVDDVISTGSTLDGMKKVVEIAGGNIVSQAAIFTEGDDPSAKKHVIALGNLPLFKI